MRSQTVTILCSGVALGVYVPALVLRTQLDDKGISTDVEVLENLLQEEKRGRIQATKIAFHRRFSRALAGQRLARDISPSLDQASVTCLLRKWGDQERTRFVVFSGFWVPILERYLQQRRDSLVRVDLCHLDASVATSWRPYAADHPCFRHVWFFNWEKKTLLRRLQISPEEPLALHRRADRCVIHGGGWGMGTYREKIAALQSLGVPLDVIVYEYRDLDGASARNRYFMIDPGWKPWERAATGRYRFPPLGEVADGGRIHFQSNERVPDVYNLIRWAKAIISKPGGATLLDSLCSCTPVVLLEPFGAYEQHNALLWEHLGFGVRYDAWQATGCSFDIFERLHRNLVRVRHCTRIYDAMRDGQSV